MASVWPQAFVGPQTPCQVFGVPCTFHAACPCLAMACAFCLWSLHLQHLAVCSPSQRALYISKSVTNVATLQKLHEGVFLGEPWVSLCALHSGPHLQGV